MPTGDPMTPARTITDQELLQLPKDGHFVKERGLGRVFAPDLLYTLPSGNRRGPDVSFMSTERLAAVPEGTVFPAVAPDLAVEVLSPPDRMKHVLDKVGEYLDAGVRMVWLIDPVKQQAAVYRTATEVRYVDAAGELDGEEVLPGFRCCLSEVLD